MEKNYWPTWFLVTVLCAAAVSALVLVHALLRAKLSPKKSNEYIETKTYLYKLPLRIWHWANALLFIGLAVSGFLKYFSILPRNIAGPVHGLMAMALLAAWVFFFIYNIASGNIKNYIVRIKGFPQRCITQAKFYLSGIFKGAKHPFHAKEGDKFNPLQQITYSAIIYIMIPALIVTGMQIRNPMMNNLMGKLHIILAVVSVVFIIGHVYLSTTGRYKNQILKGMVDGYHREDLDIADIDPDNTLVQEPSQNVHS